MSDQKPIFTKRTVQLNFHIPLPPKNSPQRLLFGIFTLLAIIIGWGSAIYHTITALHPNIPLAALYIIMLFITPWPSIFIIRDELQARKSDDSE